MTCSHNYQSGEFRVRGNLSRFADDPKTVGFLQKVKDPGHDPFYSVNPHRVSAYFISLPAGNSPQPAAETAAASG